MAQVLDERVPDVRWSGTGGALDGLWCQAPGTLVQFFPLALFGAAGGLNAEARQAAFRSSSTLHKQALGLTPGGIAASIRTSPPSCHGTHLDTAMRQEVWKSSVSREVGEQASDWQTWRATARTLPGYDPGKEADYLQRWHDYRAEAKERMAPHKEPLTRVWKAMKQGGAGSPSEIIKSIGADLLLGGGADGEDTWDEFQKEDAGAVAYEIYDQLDEKGRAGFMDGIHMLVQSFPKEEQASILSNLAKTGGRSVDDIGHGIFDRFKWSNVVESINEKANQDMVDSAGPWGATEAQKAEARQNLENIRKHRLLRTNFVDKVREMERGEYAPVRHFSGPSKDLFSTRTLEDGIYAIPSVAAYAGTAG